MMSKSHPSVVIVAGEASGDLHGAHVIRSLRQRYPRITITGAGGDAMQAAGAINVVHIRELSVMGFTAIVAKAPRLYKSLRKLRRLILRSRPDLVILIDFPDFNLHLAGIAKRNNIPVLYYISPQLWAWRSNRVHKIKKRVDHMAVILPFELPFYQKHGVPVTFVGHPLMDGALYHEACRPPDFHLDQQPRVALLPGSRESEVSRLLPEMLEAATILTKTFPEIRVTISRAPTIGKGLIEGIAGRFRPIKYEVYGGPVYRLFQDSHLTIVTSGTASLEAAIFGIPAILVYAMSAFSYALGKRLVKVPHIGLANLIAQRRIIPELVQENAKAENIAALALELMRQPLVYEKMQTRLSEIRRRMGTPGASDRVADIAVRLMESS